MPTPTDIPVKPTRASTTGQAVTEKRTQLPMTCQAEAIPRQPARKVVPLSFAQERLWFLSQLEPDNNFYVIRRVFRLRGRLDTLALEHAFTEILRRHEALRTTFPAVDGQPHQVVAAPRPLTLPLVDLQDVAESERNATILRLASEEAERPFDLARGPLLRLTLGRFTDDDHVLLLTVHHIVFDGWSMGVLTREMVALYNALSAGAPSALREPPIQYSDFSIWQREWLQGDVLETQLSYWKEQLADAPAVLELQTDRSRPRVRTARGAKQSRELPKALTESLKALSRRHGVTLFMTLLAAFKTLLYRYTGQEDIVVGTPIANRNRQETEGLIGCFINTLVLRTSLAGEPSIRDLLGRVREVCLGAYAHQDLPFERLVKELQPERDLGRTPLFQVMFVLQNAARTPDLRLRDAAMSPVDVEAHTTAFDLTLSMTETQQGLVETLWYSTDLFDAATIARMLEHLQAVLEGMVADPEQRLSRLPILSEEERRQVLVEWNDTKTEDPPDLRVERFFEDQVKRTPDAVAVAFDGARLTYRELNARANQLAHRLRSIGVGPEVLVGICMERSLEMAVGLLGVLKAGGAYVPLDPAHPKERLAFMLQDTRAPVLLTQEHVMPMLPECAAAVLCVDAEREALATQRDDDPVAESVADNAAYVIYTSGSTGRPKGVLITRRALAGHCLAAARAYGIRSNDRLLQLASLGFDVAGEELFPCWFSGAEVLLRSENVLPVGDAFVRAIEEEQVTMLNMSATHWNILVNELISSRKLVPRSLRVVIVGVQKISVERLVMWQQAGGDTIPLLNTYGPTEATVGASLYELDLDEQRQGSWSWLPIGRPVANKQIYLLDRHLQPVPIGVPGELHIGGLGLARGYLNRPELSAERFVPNPFSGDPGERLYCTGDVARYRPDGNVEFIGRIDQQVKIRGFRIEPGEVEAVLEQHPAVREALVIAREDAPGDERLVAYIVASETGLSWRAFLKGKLPDHMVPSAFVLLKALPLTPNGKVDRRALPPPDRSARELEKPYVPPRTPVEETLAGIWAEVLGRERVGAHDDFFELGGHSLLALRLMSRIHQAFGKKLPMTALFRAPTIAELAALVTDTPRRSAPCSALVPIQASGTRPPLFCVHPTGGHVMVYQHLAAALGPAQPVLGLQSRAIDDAANEHDSIDHMAAEYVRRVRRHQAKGPYCLMGWSMGGVIAVSMARQLEDEGEPVAFVALLDAYLLEGTTSTPEDDALRNLALALGGPLAETFTALDTVERQALRDSLSAPSREERLQRAIEWGRQHGLIPDDLSLAVLRQQVALTEVHERLLQSHRSRIVQAPLHVWWAAESLRKRKTHTDWSRYTTGPVHTDTVDGNHFSCIRPPRCEAFARRLAERLTTAQHRPPDRQDSEELVYVESARHSTAR